MNEKEKREWLSTKTMSERNRKGVAPYISSPSGIVLARPSPFIVWLRKVDGHYVYSTGNFLGGSNGTIRKISPTEAAAYVHQHYDQLNVIRAAEELGWTDLIDAFRVIGDQQQKPVLSSLKVVLWTS